jgi:alkylation response protein AidB-like acyl-CoA dehydrogenase
MVVETADVAGRADAFAAALAARIADEPQLRWQGMPSDADSRTAYAALGAGGWIGLHWPERLGGGGASPLETVACEERFGYRWLPLSGYLLSVKTIGNALLRFAGPELQERLLPQRTPGQAASLIEQGTGTLGGRVAASIGRRSRRRSRAARPRSSGW